MTDPKRWSDPQSDVDPVLRSLVRYGAQLAPDTEQLQDLLSRLEAGASHHRSPAARRRSRPRSRVVLGAVALAAALSGGAWAGYGGLFRAEPAAPARTGVAPSSVAPPPSPRKLASSQPVIPSVPTAPPSSTAPRPGSVLSAGPPSKAPARSAEDDARLLQQARNLVASEPARALALVREHEERFKGSPLVEERQALRIEALLGLGRKQEAGRALEAFEVGFPRSPYRRRLESLTR